jgi:ribonuclease P protein component
MASDTLKRESFEKSYRIRKRQDFLKVYEKGKPYFFRFVVVYVLKNDLDISRLGVTIPKKVGSSVMRNRIKRILKESFRRVKNSFSDNFDIVVNAKKEAVKLNYDEAKEIFASLSERIKG